MIRKPIITFTLIVLFLGQFSIPRTTGHRFSENNDISSLGYFDLMNSSFNFTSDELTLLDRNGFVVLNRLGTDDILDAYKYYWENDLPVIITTDTMLQAWHLIFDEILVKTEENLFFPLLKTLTHEMVDTFTSKINVTDDDTAVLDTLVYLSVGAKLADPTVTVPQTVSEPTNQILKAINNEITIFDAIEQFQTKETQRFIDDFSMYRPRGHYIQSENLASYFRLFKWLSRIPFFFDDYPGSIYLKRTPEELIRSAVYLVYLMKNSHVSLEGLGIDADGLEIWEGFKKFLDVLTGETYMVTPSILDQITSTIEQTETWHPDIVDQNDLKQIQDQVLNDESIPSPKDPFIIDALNPECALIIAHNSFAPSCSPKSMLLFGERLALDTYALNHLVFPYVEGPWFDDPQKYLPNGLELATTILKSERAHSLLSNIDHPQYQTQLNKTQEEMENWPSGEKQSLSWNWMQTLKHLVYPQPEFNESSIPVAPQFMKTTAWMDEKLTTVLGSWAQLKRDMILYQKQGITGPACLTPEGYVEPYPQFYNALAQLSELFKNSIGQLESIGLNLSVGIHYEVDTPYRSVNLFPIRTLDNFTAILQKLEGIAYHELHGIELTTDEKEFIMSVYQDLPIMCAPTQVSGWLGVLLGSLKYEYLGLAESPNTRASAIADIHTDLNIKKTLEVATGYLEHLVAIVPGWNGTDILAVGPVFSYYEFSLPMKARMTDEDWRGVLLGQQNGSLGQNNDLAMHSRGFWAQSYMVSTEMTTSVIYEEVDVIEAPQWVQSGEFSIGGVYPVDVLLDGFHTVDWTSGISPQTSTAPTLTASSEVTGISPETNTNPGKSTSPGFDFFFGSIAVMVASLAVFFRNRKHRK